jgi:phage-related minor tail protein
VARKLEVQIVGDASSLNRAFRDATGHAGRFGNALGRVAKAGVFAAGAAGVGGMFLTLRAGLSDWKENVKVAAQTAAVLKSTGATAGVTAKHIQDLATTIEHYSGVDDEAVKAGENVLLSFTHIRNAAGKNGDVFDRATKLVTDFAVRTGRDVPQAALLLGKALEDPAHKVSALARAGIVFSDSQKKTIAKLAESGHM